MVDETSKTSTLCLEPSFEDLDLQDRSMGTSRELVSFTEHRPSIAGSLRMGYFSMDRACQTDVSDIINLKETTQLLVSLVQDVSLLKKNLYYAKLALQADYDAKLEEKALELYTRTNNRITEIEKTHEERVKIVRHSFRTQLADTIKKMSMDYHKYYTRKEDELDAQHNDELERLAKLQEEQRLAQQAQQDMIEMMKLQMDDEEEEEEIAEEVKEPPPSISLDIERHYDEIRQLTDTIYNLEVRIEELEDLLEETNKDNRKLMKDLESFDKKLTEEQTISAQLKRDLMELQVTLEMERRNAGKKLEQQKHQYERRIKHEIQEAKDQVHSDTEKRIHHLNERSRMREKQLRDQSALKEMMMQQRQQELIDAQKDDDTHKLKEIEQKQRQEIIRLQKEVERINKTWELKVTILQQTIHSLKDEMFLRQSLQRQAAKLQHAAISYASEGPAAVPAGILPSKSPVPVRRHQLPTLVQAPKPSSELMSYKEGRSTESDSERRRKSKGSSVKDSLGKSPLYLSGPPSATASSITELKSEA